MITLGLLLTRQHRLLSVAAILDVFESVNRFCEKEGKAPSFDIHVVTQVKEHTLPGNYRMGSLPRDKMDIIFIPAFAADDIQTAIQENTACIPWLREQYSLGAELASFCTGAFLLAATGLLNGKRATTHIDAMMSFSNAFPQVRLEGHSVVTEDNGIYTSGGATSSFHLMLHLIQCYCGRDMALRIAKMFAIDMDRVQQSYFGTFTPAQTHGDQLVVMAQKKIEAGYTRTTTIEEIIQDLPASRRNVVRRFKHATGVTPIEYLQKTRIEAAKKLLEHTDQSVMEIMLSTGYNDLKAFRQLFKKTAGITPKEYREKFNRV
ncbi:HTH-type transcriptional activator RhaR [Dyadobacter sp. CECT 9275]|uniref:HTH-type transcriptional activator RhaR n=1 Tax=Dyadobacter helix TaxID=2822344 RepID=A0A916J717_9BACT|nr:helix-turn-helix domain-containing protein [Dyadobacter sp. CECT 9275]CAG4989973.1 HTH-type transcriptional activator RhaR [Dyadobacter sp. CECT 9275]